MNYLVLRPKDPFCEIKVYSNPDEKVDLPYEVWSLRTGKQILFVENRMARVLKNVYLHGTYQNGALHAYSYDEMNAVLTDLLGPSDAERYETLMEVEAGSRRLMMRGRAYFASYFAVEAGSFAVRVMWMGLKFLMLMLVLPFIIHMLSKKR